MPAEPIRYSLSFPDLRHHHVEVAASLPTSDVPSIELSMAVWTPGSYLIREYSRHVERITARKAGGDPLPVRKTRKNRWVVETAGEARIIVSYRVYCRQLSVRGNWVDEEFALLNGAPTFLTLYENHQRPHEVRITLPPSWKKCLSPLPASTEEQEHHLRAPDFDTLVDSPILAGNPVVHEFEAGGRKHYLVNQGEAGIWDGPKSAADIEKIVREQHRTWGVVPYDHYFFFNLMTETGGGLEHKDSCVLMTSRWNTRKRKPYLDWLGLVSHEFFHVWNVKRLRPVELGPLSYEEEVYTRGLWIAEGITSYYTDLLLSRAGLCSEEEYLSRLSKILDRLQTTPGRLVESLEQSSFDAWIKLYRQDENSVNSTISYYVKGAVVAFLLDVKIRKSTGSSRSLDDVLRLAYERHAAERGFSTDEFLRTAQEVAGGDLSGWFEKVLTTTEELDYSEALDWFGLRFKEPRKADGGDEVPVAENDGRAEEDTVPRAWLGLETRNEAGRLIVTGIRRDTPAHDSSIDVRDEILAIDDFRVLADGWEKRLERYQPGDRVELLVARRERIVRLGVTLGEDPGKRWRFEVCPEASEEQSHRRKLWLAPRLPDNLPGDSSRFSTDPPDADFT